MRKYISILCLCFLLFAVATAEAARTVRVGFFSLHGFQETLEDGRRAGFGYQYLQRLAEVTGWHYEYVEGSWAECLERLERGEIDILGAVQRTPERERVFAFPAIQSGQSYVTLYARADSSLSYEDFKAFDGMRVGILRGAKSQRRLEEYSSRNGFAFQPVFFDQEQELDAALNNGAIDTLLTINLNKTLNQRLIARFSPEPTYFAVNKDNVGLLRELNQAQEDIKTADPYYEMRLYDRFYHERSQDKLVFSAAEHRALAALGQLRVAYVDGWEPLASYDSGQPTGIAADVFRAMARETGLNCVFVRAVNSQDALNKVKGDAADAVCFLERDERLAERYGLRMTRPYMRIPIAKLTRIGHNPEHPKALALPQHFEEHLAYLQQSSDPEATILWTDSPRSACTALLEGRADFVYTNIYTSNFLLARPYYAELAATSLVDYATEFSVGLSTRMDPAVLSAFNKVITKIEPSELTNIIISNTAKPPAPSLSRVIQAYPLWTMSLFVSIVLVMLFGFTKVIMLKNRTNRRIQDLLDHDRVTGLWNLNKFIEEGAQRILSDRCALLYIDIDSFKYINELYGYDGGNALLELVSGKLRTFLEEGEILAKIAADHFALLVHYNGRKALDARIKKLDELLRSVSNSELNCTVLFSCGICVVNPGDTIEEVLDHAHYAKDMRRRVHANTYIYFDEGIMQGIREEKVLEERMNSALSNGEFIPYFQPKVDMGTGKLVGAEALVRWQHATRGLIPPSEFIPLFERNGFIVKIDFRIYEETCRCIRGLLDAGEKVVPISCNFSRIHFLDRAFPDKLFGVVKRYGIPAELIEVELTETIAMGNESMTLRQVKRLKELGFRISIDDFGTGYSSLSLLCKLDMDMLKLDKVFLQQALLSSCSRELIECIIQTAGRLGITVLCEGVETEEQAVFLQGIGCALAQGYLYDKPLPEDQFLAKWSGRA